MKVKNGTHRLGRLFSPFGYGYRGRHTHTRRGSRAYVRELHRADGRPWWTAHYGPTSASLARPAILAILSGMLFVVATFAPEPFPASACWERPDLIRFGYCWWDGR